MPPPTSSSATAPPTSSTASAATTSCMAAAATTARTAAWNDTLEAAAGNRRVLLRALPSTPPPMSTRSPTSPARPTPIFLDDAVFTALAAGTLAAGAFVVRRRRVCDADDRILYDSATGRSCSTMPTAPAPTAAVLFATLDSMPGHAGSQRLHRDLSSHNPATWNARRGTNVSTPARSDLPGTPGRVHAARPKQVVRLAPAVAARSGWKTIPVAMRRGSEQ